MQRPSLEVADIFLKHGAAWRDSQRGHLSLSQLKVMSAIEQCRTAALGGHVLRCDSCATELVSYNSCRNRHCPKCQSAAAKRWLDARQAHFADGKKSPMGYNFGAYAEATAEAISYTEMKKRVLSRGK